MIESLGIIETRGYTAAIQAADAAVKAARVKLGQTISIGGGKVSIVVRGDIAAVNAAVEAAVKVVSRMGTIEAEVIIPRPSEKLLPVFPLEAI